MIPKDIKEARIEEALESLIALGLDKSKALDVLLAIMTDKVKHVSYIFLGDW